MTPLVNQELVDQQAINLLRSVAAAHGMKVEPWTRMSWAEARRVAATAGDDCSDGEPLYWRLVSADRDGDASTVRAVFDLVGRRFEPKIERTTHGRALVGRENTDFHSSVPVGSGRVLRTEGFMLTDWQTKRRGVHPLRWSVIMAGQVASTVTAE